MISNRSLAERSQSTYRQVLLSILLYHDVETKLSNDMGKLMWPIAKKKEISDINAMLVDLYTPV